jgi:serine/threonine protein kinase
MHQNTLSVEQILTDAVEIADIAERQAFVQKACGDNVGLRAKVERLIANHDRAGFFLDCPAAVLDTAAISERPVALGTCIGQYKLREIIGEGGMGVVYLAEQHKPVRRQVALKVIKPGMDSKQIVARFETERQALAMMDHSNIAKVLDAGTTDNGRPYFVMELVRGIAVTDYCDQARLTIRQRLDLFIHVCRAVQHAHTKGIIHRDLKPTNVLVTSDDGVPVPKVIDFGVAKAMEQSLTECSLHTGFAQMIGTPLYMSPEQAEFNLQGVDTRSDIYSLGVLLYELLTGDTPFEKQRLRIVDFDELRRILREEEPPLPSDRLSTLGAGLSTASERRGVDPRELKRTLNGELDWIVQKSLEKDRSRRYESASAFAADVQRYLKDEPVEACPPSLWYRAGKFSRRHRQMLATIAAIGVALVAATAVSVWQAMVARDSQHVAEAAQRRAATEAASARAVSDFLQTDLLGQAHTDPRFRETPGANADLTVKEALDRAAAKIGTRFQDQPLVEATIRMAIGRAYRSLGRNKLAIPHLERALALRRANLDLGDQKTLESMDNLAEAYLWVVRVQEAIALGQEALEYQLAVRGIEHPDTLARVARIAHAFEMANQLDRAIPLHEELLEKKRRILGPTAPSTFDTMHHLAMCYTRGGRLAESLALYRELLDSLKSTNGPEHDSTIWPRMTFAQAHQKAGELEQADLLLREALAAIQKQVPSFRWRAARARTLGWLARSQLLRKNDHEAEALLRETVSVLDQSEVSVDPSHSYWKCLLGAALLGQGKIEEAEPLILQSYKNMKNGSATHHVERNRLAEAGEWVVRFYEATNQPEKARAWREKLSSN